MFSLADKGPLSHDGSLVGGGVDELVASVAGHRPKGMVGGVAPHLVKQKNATLLSFKFKPGTALRGGGREGECLEVQEPGSGDPLGRQRGEQPLPVE